MATEELFVLLDKSRGSRVPTGIPFIDAMTGVVPTKEKSTTPPPGENYLVDLVLGRVRAKSRNPIRPGSLASLIAGPPVKTKDIKR